MRSLPLLVLFLSGILAMPAHATTLTVFAAASTVQVVDAVRNEWNANQTPQFRVVYGSSGALARQLENGGPADIYFSANSTWVDYLVKNRIAINQTRQTLFRNRIVLVAPASTQSTSQFAGQFNLSTDIGAALGPNGRLAIGDPQHVPAGIYGRQALTSLGLWSQFAHRTVQTRNVRLALALVQRGEAPLGIVYYTDAIQTGQVRIVATFNGSLHAPIEYQAVAVAPPTPDGTPKDATARLLAYLASEPSRKIYRKFGFLAR